MTTIGAQRVQSANPFQPGNNNNIPTIGAAPVQRAQPLAGLFAPTIHK